MNIGLGEDEKHGAKAPEYYLRRKYRSEDFEEKRVLVVDEYVSSGGSLRRAMKSLQDIYGIKPDGIANFVGLPEWYGSTGSGVIGVTDFEYNHEFNSVKKKMQRIDLFTASSIWEVHKTLNKETFESVIGKIRFVTSKGKFNEEKLVDQVLKFVNVDIDREDIKKIVKFVSDNELKANDGKHVWQFVDSAGGFTSRKIEDDELNANGRLYRQVLKSIVSLYMFERQMEKTKN